MYQCDVSVISFSITKFVKISYLQIKFKRNIELSELLIFPLYPRVSSCRTNQMKTKQTESFQRNCGDCEADIQAGISLLQSLTLNHMLFYMKRSGSHVALCNNSLPHSSLCHTDTHSYAWDNFHDINGLLGKKEEHALF